MTGCNIYGKAEYFNPGESVKDRAALFIVKDAIKKKILELKKKKDSTQPTKIKTSGSTFKNPINQTNKKVWELIKESVPLNTTFGDACISDKHCNFFVNKNNASFKDMIKLIEFVRENVEKKTGIKLEKEIKILGKI